MMKKILILIASVLLCLILQITLIGGIQAKGGKPDLLLILLVLWAWNTDWKQGLLAGFFIGLLEDILFSPLLGLNAFSLSLTGFVVGEVKERVYEENVVALLLVTAAASLLNGIVFFSWARIFNIFSSFLGKISSLTLPTSLYNCLLMFFIFLIKGKFGREKIH